MAKKNIAELFVDTLVLAGVKRVYGVAGDSLNGITDVIRTDERIKWIHVRHEETAAFAAGAEAHLTGSLVVCAGSCGPGNLHLINGLYDANRQSWMNCLHPTIAPTRRRGAVTLIISNDPIETAPATPTCHPSRHTCSSNWLHAG